MKSLMIAKIAIQELFHERVFYIIICFAALTLATSFLFGQMTYTQHGRITLNFLLAAIQISMLLFSIFAGISLFQKEIISGSVSMVLSKPISRSSFLIGKYIGQIITQFFVITIMGLITHTFLAVFYEIYEGYVLFQTLLLIFFEVMVLTAVTYFFSVIAGAMTSAILTICWFCIGHFWDIFSSVLEKKNLISWTTVRTLIPNLEVFNMKDLASYAISISSLEIGYAFLYSLCCIAFYLTIGCLFFEQKDILT
jgi:ABC-type transport system involved in multi-copper enzyme maturation permease subunit